MEQHENHKDYLYHYTSFETLALILTNRTLCFNSLINVDDMEEAETADLGNFGRMAYVSCWTEDSEESIALWSLYTPSMHGVRIGLPRFPFRQYSYKKRQFGLSEDTTTFIDLDEMNGQRAYTISQTEPSLFPVEYTNDTQYLCPTIKSHLLPGKGLPLPGDEEYDKMEIHPKERILYSTGMLGKYKRCDWAFQHEWRYRILAFPIATQEMNTVYNHYPSFIVDKIEKPDEAKMMRRLFLRLDEKAVNNMEIVLGPKMSEAEKIYVKALLKEHGLEKNWTESRLRIR